MDNETKLMRRRNSRLTYERNKMETKIFEFLSVTPIETLTSADIKRLFQLYQALEATYLRPKKSVRLTRILLYLIFGAYITDERNSTSVAKLLDSLLKIQSNNILFLLLPEELLPSHLMFEFLLDHTNKEKSLFSGHRLIVLPLYHLRSDRLTLIEEAVISTRPDLLHCLLRYGAVYSRVEVYSKHSRQTFSAISSKLFADLITIIIDWIDNFNPETHSCEQAVKCGCLLLMEMPQMKFPKIHVAEGVRPFLTKIDAFIPGFKDFFYKPLSLKHSSKLAVRKALNKNWQLPHGIYRLAIPNELKDYLDLMDAF